MSNNKKIIAALLFLGLLIAGYLGYAWYRDYSKFTKVSSQLDSLIEDIHPLGVESVEKEEYCSYGHQKYSKGDLGCGLNLSYTLKNNQSIGTVDMSVKKLKWNFLHDNTKSTNESSEKKYIKHEVYEVGDLSCLYGVIESIDEKYTIEMSCYGAAKMEYFPVRE